MSSASFGRTGKPKTTRARRPISRARAPLASMAEKNEISSNADPRMGLVSVLCRGDATGTQPLHPAKLVISRKLAGNCCGWMAPRMVAFADAGSPFNEVVRTGDAVVARRSRRLSG